MNNFKEYSMSQLEAIIDSIKAYWEEDGKIPENIWITHELKADGYAVNVHHEVITEMGIHNSGPDDTDDKRKVITDSIRLKRTFDVKELNKKLLEALDEADCRERNWEV
jgi:hypothetical protein